MKTLIQINRATWGQVKNFATVKDLSLNSAVELLLASALNRLGYFERITEAKNAWAVMNYLLNVGPAEKQSIESARGEEDAMMMLLRIT